LEIKPKVRHFDATEAIQAKSQAMMNILTKQDFQNAFRKWKKSWERCIRVPEGEYFEEDGGQ
jgi:hypothetical protein